MRLQPAIIALILFVVIAQSTAAYAQICPYNPGGAPAAPVPNVTDFSACPGPDEAGLTHRLVICVRAGLLEAVDVVYEAVYDTLEQAIYALIMLTVMIFGIKYATGMVQKKAGELILEVIKIAAVIYVVANFDDWIPSIYEVMDDFLDIVTSPLMASNAMMNMMCSDSTEFWPRVDCMLGAFLGFGAMSTIVSGIMGLVMAMLLDNSDIGGLAFLGGAAAGITFLLSMVRAVFAFLVANIAVTFLAILAPLFVPMLLLERTKNYFTKWTQSFMSYILQPVFLFGFLALSLVAIDKAIFTGDVSLATIMFGQPVASVNEWNCMMENYYNVRVTTEEQIAFWAGAQMEDGDEMRQDTQVGTIDVPESSTQMIPEAIGTAIDGPLGKVLDPAMSGMMGLTEGFMTFGQAVVVVDEDLMLPIMIHFFALALICYLLYMLLEVIPEIARDVVGVFSHAKLGTSAIPGQSLAQPLMNNASNLASNVYQNVGNRN